MLEVVVAGLAVLDALALERLPASDQPAEGRLPRGGASAYAWLAGAEAECPRRSARAAWSWFGGGCADLALVHVLLSRPGEAMQYLLHYTLFVLRPSIKKI